VRFEGFRNKSAVDFIKRAMEKESNKRNTIYELINHPFLNSPHENQLLIC
jgi:serine/threonine protein kinase